MNIVQDDHIDNVETATFNQDFKSQEGNEEYENEKIDTQKSDFLVANMIQDQEISEISGESPYHDTKTDTFQRDYITNIAQEDEYSAKKETA